MKTRKVFAGIAAVAAASALSVSVCAADWAQAGYADDNPDTVNILSTNADGAECAQVVDGTAVKLRITLDQILENPEDCSKIKTGSYKAIYKGLAGSDIQGIGGGLYAATGNSATFWISPVVNEDGSVTWEDEVVVEDTFKYLLPSSVPANASESEYVFMDWSNSNFLANGVTITFTDLHLYDADGNEIAQKAYSGDAAAPTAEETAPVEEAAPAAEEAAPVEEAAPAAEETAPAADSTTASTATGNTSAAGIAAVMAVSAAAAFAAKRK